MKDKERIEEFMRQTEARYERVADSRFLVARLDGRGFTKLTEICQLEKPFDAGFAQMMENTTRHLMGKTGFRMLYGYTQSDEISLLFHQDDDTFGRRYSKLISVLAGEASSCFFAHSAVTKVSGSSSFDCRLLGELYT